MKPKANFTISILVLFIAFAGCKSKNDDAQPIQPNGNVARPTAFEFNNVYISSGSGENYPADKISTSDGILNGKFITALRNVQGNQYVDTSSLIDIVKDAALTPLKDYYNNEIQLKIKKGTPIVVYTLNSNQKVVTVTLTAGDNSYLNYIHAYSPVPANETGMRQKLSICLAATNKTTDATMNAPTFYSLAYTGF